MAKWIKWMIAVALCITMMIPALTPAIAAGYSPGTYTGTAQGFGGEIAVTLTVNESDILDVVITGDNETAGIGSNAVEKMPAQILQAQSANVDGVSGATVSSNAIRNAAQDAINAAMGIEKTVADVHMKPGSYLAEARGYSSTELLAMRVTVDEEKILSIEPQSGSDSCETDVMLENVLEVLVPRILENQSLAVDALTGATATSSAVKAATDSAVRLALLAGGSDESAMENFYKPVPKTGEGVTVELDADVVVVGLGPSGIMAAASAVESLQKETGRQEVNVIGIDKASKIGGSSCGAHSALIINPEKYQAEHNNGEDYVDQEAFRQDWLNYTTNYDGTQGANVEILDFFLDHSGETLDWLAYDHGYVFDAPTGGNKAVGSNGNAISNSSWLVRYNYVSGSISYEQRRATVYQWHKKMLDDVVVGNGGSYMTETEGYDLIFDAEANKVTGVKARNLVDGTEYIIHADAVILATGGFLGSSEYTSEWLKDNKYYPMLASPNWMYNGMGQNDGKMIAAALNIGAGTCGIGNIPITLQETATTGQIHDYPVNFMKEEGIYNRTGRTKTWSLNDTPIGLAVMPTVLAVDREGNRTVNEYHIGVANEGDFITPKSITMGSTFYGIVSKVQLEDIAANGFAKEVNFPTYFGQGGVPRNMPIPEVYDVLDCAIKAGYVYQADTIAELAEKIGIGPEKLNATVDRYNELCEMGEDVDLGKDAKYLQPVNEGPYYAITGSVRPFSTGGALDVNTKLQVKTKDGLSVIEGLYAVGNDSMGGLLCGSKNYIGYGGAIQGWCITSGHMAGIYAGEYVAEDAQ